MYFWHALPLGWESMEYHTFLQERRQRMAQVIRTAFEQLPGGGNVPRCTFLPHSVSVLY